MNRAGSFTNVPVVISIIHLKPNSRSMKKINLKEKRSIRVREKDHISYIIVINSNFSELYIKRNPISPCSLKQLAAINTTPPHEVILLGLKVLTKFLSERKGRNLS